MSKGQIANPSENPYLADPDEVCELLGALANPNRLRIFWQLRDACPLNREDADVEICVGDISSELTIDPSTVSHHLKELERVGLIKTQRRGRNIVCRVVCKRLIDALEALTCPAHRDSG